MLLIGEILQEALPNVFCPKIITTMLDLFGVESKMTIHFWYSIGFSIYALCLYNISTVNFELLLDLLELNFDISIFINIEFQIIIPALKLLHDLIIEMGSVHANVLHRKKMEAEFQKNETERQKNEAERQKNEEFRKKLLAEGEKNEAERKKNSDILTTTQNCLHLTKNQFACFESENKKMESFCSQLAEFCLNFAKYEKEKLLAKKSSIETHII